MTNKYCSKCGAELQEGTKFCPKCGAPVLDVTTSNATGDSRENKRKALFVLIGVLFILFFIIFGAIAYSEYSEYSEKKQIMVARKQALIEAAREDSEREAEAKAKEKEEKMNDEAIIKFITDMYNNTKYVDDSFLESHCSEQMLKKLQEEYDYDCYEGNCYAVWLFRSGNQDGISDRNEIISVEALGGHWYRYDYYDMGYTGANKIKVIKQNGAFIIEDVEYVE